MGLRNVVHRRNHKERSQPSNRSKLGLLEKHKDYILRARDHHSKQDRLKLLRSKAASRNKDEFYFSMINSQTRNGIHITSRGNAAMENDVVQLLKTQDSGYLRTQINKEKRAIEILKNRIMPCVPEMRVDWIEEKEHRKLSLVNAGLISIGDKKGEGNRKQKRKEKERWEISEVKGEKVGSLGKKTVWVAGDDQVRAYKPSTSNSTTPSSEPSSSSSGQDFNDDLLSDEEMMDSPSDNDGSEGEEGDESQEEVDADGDFADDIVDDELAAAEDERIKKGGVKKFEKHLSHLLRLLLSRQFRLSTLQEASSKLSLARSLMSTKGQSVRKLPNEKEKSFLEKVAEGKLTKNGLAMPGIEDDEVDEVDGGKKAVGRFKWGKERKK